jgi:hypothetical protein
MKLPLTYLFRRVCFIALIFSASLSAHAAVGEMGTGVPNIGIYSGAVGNANIRIWSLANPTINFPTGCTSILISRSTVGDDYKVMLSVILTAKSLGKPVRFYAHAERDGGCGVDYVHLD